MSTGNDSLQSLSVQNWFSMASPVTIVLSCTVLACAIVLSSTITHAEEAPTEKETPAFERHHVLRLAVPVVNINWAIGGMGFVVSDSDQIGSTFTPGFQFSYVFRPYRHFGVGAGVSYFAMWNDDHALHDIRTTGQIKAVFPFFENKMDVSVGAEAGLLLAPFKMKWEPEGENWGFGYGPTVGALIQYNWFMGNWGITAGMRAGLETAHQKNDDQFTVLNFFAFDIGAVYQF